MAWLLRLDTALGSLMDRIAGDPPPAHSAAPRAVALISIGTLAGNRRFDAVLEAVAARSEAHDLTWIE
jgi:hypothetical protein